MSSPLDMFFLPPSTRADVQIFRVSGYGTTLGGVTNAPVTWRKPRGISMIHVLAIAGGGGGGGGYSRAAGNAKSGGGGGGPGNLGFATYPAILIPDILYVYVGQGGEGGDPATAGGYGGRTLVQYATADSIYYSLIFLTGGNRGGAGTTGAGGAGGTALAADTSNGPLMPLGNITLRTQAAGGSNGGAGAGAVGANASGWGTSTLTGGAGGGGCTTTDFAGGPVIIGTSYTFDIVQFTTNLVNGGIAGGGNGNPGVSIMKPFLQCGGSGGGSNDSGQAGSGGRGGIGCGGGGGGAGTTGGKGGPGGSGLVIIISW